MLNLLQKRKPNETLKAYKYKDWNYNYINLGLEINSRAKATPSKPYIKNYFKEIELQTKSLQFYDLFLKEHLKNNNDTIKDLARIEYTIKGYSHKKRLIDKAILKNNYKTLNELVHIDENSFLNIIKIGFSDYIFNPFKEFSKSKVLGITPTDQLICNLMQQIVLNGGTHSDLFDVLKEFHNIDDATKKTRLKTKINKLINHIKTNSLDFDVKLKENKEVKTFLRKWFI